MAPSLAAIAFYRTEEAAQAVIKALEREGFVIKQILTAPAYSPGNTSAGSWDYQPAYVGVALFVSNTVPSNASISDAPRETKHPPEDTPPVDCAASEPHDHIVIVYRQAKEQAIETLTEKKPVQMHRY